MRNVVAILLVSALAACGPSIDDGVVDIAVIGPAEDLFDKGLRLSVGGQHVRAAQAQGLVRIDARGQVVPGIAERWIVTDDGRSYIFRIREFDLPGGERLSAQAVRDSLTRTVRQLDGTSLGLDLTKIRDIRAMTGRVVEIRLNSSMPDLLQLLAQPELGLVMGEAAIGPMALSRDGDVAVLDALPPQLRGLPEQPEWDEQIRQIRMYGRDAAQATEGFAEGRFDMIIGGRLATLPYADPGPLSRGTIRLDAAIGLFGLDVQRADGVLETVENREAIAMAIDRGGLLQAFNIGGWTPTTRIVPSGLPGDTGTVSERWSNRTLEQRRQQGLARVTRWEAENDAQAVVTIRLPEGPGSDLLFAALARDLATIGVEANRATEVELADLALRDRAARYGSARWFLNQFNCSVSRACSGDADYLVELGLEARTLAEEYSYLAEAETVLTATNLYIPLGAPIRWSMVRADVTGFTENAWSLHPLFPLSRAPI